MDVIHDEQYVLKCTGKEFRLLAIGLNNLITVPNHALAHIEGAIKIAPRDREAAQLLNDTLLRTRATHLKDLLNRAEMAMEKAKELRAPEEKEEAS